MKLTKRDITLAAILFKSEPRHGSVARTWLREAGLLEDMDTRIERWMLANEYVLFTKDVRSGRHRGRVYYQITTKGVVYLRSRGLWATQMEPHLYMHRKGLSYVPYTGPEEWQMCKRCENIRPHTHLDETPREYNWVHLG